MLRFSDARNFGRTLTGLALIVGPLALLVGAVISPDADNDNKVKELNTIAAHKGTYITGGLVYLFASVVLLAAAVGLIHVFRGRRVTLGQIAGSLLLIGAAVTVAFYAFTVVEYEMVNQGGLNRADLALYLHKSQMTSAGAPLFILFLLGVVLGQILLAIAAWRKRLVPVWAAALILLAGLVAFAGQSKGVNIVDGALALIGVGMIGRAVLAMTDEDWDAPRDTVDKPASQTAPATPAPA